LSTGQTPIDIVPSFVSKAGVKCQYVRNALLNVKARRELRGIPAEEAALLLIQTYRLDVAVCDLDQLGALFHADAALAQSHINAGYTSTRANIKKTEDEQLKLRFSASFLTSTRREDVAGPSRDGIRAPLVQQRVDNGRNLFIFPNRVLFPPAHSKRSLLGGHRHTSKASLALLSSALTRPLSNAILQRRREKRARQEHLACPKGERDPRCAGEFQCGRVCS
jgi:hypothetical protein